MTGDVPIRRPPPPPASPVDRREHSPFIPGSPILRVPGPLFERGEAVPGWPITPTPGFKSRGRNEQSETSPSPDSRGKSRGSAHAIQGPKQQQCGWLAGLADGL